MDTAGVTIRGLLVTSSVLTALRAIFNVDHFRTQLLVNVMQRYEELSFLFAVIQHSGCKSEWWSHERGARRYGAGLIIRLVEVP